MESRGNWDNAFGLQRDSEYRYLSQRQASVQSRIGAGLLKVWHGIILYMRFQRRTLSSTACSSSDSTRFGVIHELSYPQSLVSLHALHYISIGLLPSHLYSTGHSELEPFIRIQLVIRFTYRPTFLRSDV